MSDAAAPSTARSKSAIEKWPHACATRRWRSATIVVATSVLLVNCGSDASSPATSELDQRSSSSATSEAPATSTEPADSPVEGKWQTGPVSLEETEGTLRRNGLGRWVEDYRRHAPFSGDTVLILTIENGAWDLYGESGGGQPQPIDYDAEYEIVGDKVVFHHSDGSNSYRWTVEADTLSLQFVRGTMPSYEGIPDEVFQRALYMTAPFTRQG